MTNFKYLDFWVNVILIVGFTAKGFTNLDDTILYGYFIVGGWQTISMVVHIINKKLLPISATRNAYHWVAGLSIAGMATVVYFVVLLFAAPFMAIFYTSLCGYEIYGLKKIDYETI